MLRRVDDDRISTLVGLTSRCRWPDGVDVVERVGHLGGDADRPRPARTCGPPGDVDRCDHRACRGRPTPSRGTADRCRRLAEMEPADDARALDGQQHARLGQEAAAHLVVAAPVVGEDLDRHVAGRGRRRGPATRWRTNRYPGRARVGKVQSSARRARTESRRSRNVPTATALAGTTMGRRVDFEEIERTGRLAAAGDRAALDRLLVGVRPLILGRCRQFLPNPLDAEEAAQDALLADRPAHRHVRGPRRSSRRGCTS